MCSVIGALLLLDKMKTFRTCRASAIFVIYRPSFSILFNEALTNGFLLGHSLICFSSAIMSIAFPNSPQLKTSL